MVEIGHILSDDGFLNVEFPLKAVIYPIFERFPDINCGGYLNHYAIKGNLVDEDGEFLVIRGKQMAKPGEHRVVAGWHSVSRLNFQLSSQGFGQE